MFAIVSGGGRQRADRKNETGFSGAEKHGLNTENDIVGQLCCVFFDNKIPCKILNFCREFYLLYHFFVFSDIFICISDKTVFVVTLDF